MAKEDLNRYSVNRKLRLISVAGNRLLVWLIIQQNSGKGDWNFFLILSLSLFLKFSYINNSTRGLYMNRGKLFFMCEISMCIRRKIATYKCHDSRKIKLNCWRRQIWCPGAKIKIWIKCSIDELKKR